MEPNSMTSWMRAIRPVGCVLAGIVAVFGGVHAGDPVDAQSPARVDFARDVEPILRESCTGCHGPEQQLGGFRLDQRTAARGINRIRPGSSATSRVYLRISGS